MKATEYHRSGFVCNKFRTNSFALLSFSSASSLSSSLDSRVSNISSAAANLSIFNFFELRSTALALSK